MFLVLRSFGRLLGLIGIPSGFDHSFCIFNCCILYKNIISYIFLSFAIRFVLGYLCIYTKSYSHLNLSGFV